MRVSLMHVTCSVCLILLEWMTLTTVCEYYKLLTAHYAYVYGLLGVDVVSFVDKLHLMRSWSISTVPAARCHIPQHRDVLIPPLRTPISGYVLSCRILLLLLLRVA